MAINAISPFEGTLEWVGTPNEGQTAKGTWKSVDFVLKYQDHQMEDQFLALSAFGADKVNQITSYALGTPLRVVWWPKANQSKNGDRWWPKNDVLHIGIVQQAKAADTKNTAPSFPQQGTQMPGGYAPMPQQKPYPQPEPPLPPMPDYTPNEEDGLPF